MNNGQDENSVLNYSLDWFSVALVYYVLRSTLGMWLTIKNDLLLLRLIKRSCIHIYVAIIFFKFTELNFIMITMQLNMNFVKVNSGQRSAIAWRRACHLLKNISIIKSKECRFMSILLHRKFLKNTKP